MRERFLARVGGGFTDECHEWPGTKGAFGYGVISTGVGTKRTGAHRVSYEAFVGPIPDGLHVLHSCDNPPCVNPAHLRVGTPRDNAGDRRDRRRHTPPRFDRDEHPRTRITTSVVREIQQRATLHPNSNIKQLAEEYGVHFGTIYAVLKEKV